MKFIKTPIFAVAAAALSACAVEPTEPTDVAKRAVELALEQRWDDMYKLVYSSSAIGPAEFADRMSGVAAKNMPLTEHCGGIAELKAKEVKRTDKMVLVEVTERFKVLDTNKCKPRTSKAILIPVEGKWRLRVQ